jgi:hypothetical protein
VVRSAARTAGVAAVVCALSVGADASASPLIDLAGGMSGQGGLQGGTVESGAAAAYFNPALLVDAPPGITFGVLVMSEQIGVSLDGRPGTQYAVPDGVANATHANGSPIGNVPLPTGLLQNGRAADVFDPAIAPRPRQGAGTGHETFAYEEVGFVLDLFDQRLALGFYGMIPDGNFTNLTAFYDDEREQYFTNSLHPELYADRLTALSFAFGAGWKASDSLSVGLGASLMLKAGVGAPTFVANAGELQNILIDTNADVNVSVSPVLGVRYRPSPRLHLTASAHAPEKEELGVNFTFLLPTGLQQGSTFTLVYDYMPWEVAAGLAYDVVQNTDDTVTVAGTALYQKWSDYEDRHGESPIAAYGWYDTITPTVGVRYRHAQTLVSLDAQYKPTPVPDQTGRTNYVDNDRIGGSAGIDYAFSLWHSRLHVGAQAEVFELVPRHQTKLPTPTSPDGINHTPALVADEVPDDSQVAGLPLAGSQGLQTNNPGWPGFGSSGYVLGAGIYVSVAP